MSASARVWGVRGARSVRVRGGSGKYHRRETVRGLGVSVSRGGTRLVFVRMEVWTEGQETLRGCVDQQCGTTLV
eukprot:2580297-Rhodomonas_salina.1